MNYSIRYLDARGITDRCEFLPFETDGDATTYAEADLPNHFMVETWKGENLLARTFRDAPTT